MCSCFNGFIYKQYSRPTLFYCPIEPYKRFIRVSRGSPRAIEKCSRAKKKKKKGEPVRGGLVVFYSLIYTVVLPLILSPPKRYIPVGLLEHNTYWLHCIHLLFYACNTNILKTAIHFIFFKWLYIFDYKINLFISLYEEHAI